MDAPTVKKIENMIEKLDIKRLNIMNERELELVIWGLLNARWANYIKYRKGFGGRTADIAIAGIPVEIKFVKTISDKDRCVGQVIDYLSEVETCIVIAIDPKDYMKSSALDKIAGCITIII